MNRAIHTREKLLTEGRRLIWSRGYSAVSLREIAQAAGVDVALVSRYFGSKRGLFEATLEGAFDMPPVADVAALREAIVAIFREAPRGGDTPSILTLVLMNAKDREVGELVRAAQASRMQAGLEALIGNRQQAALLMAVLLGFSVAEKALHLDGIPPHDSPAYEAQLRHLIDAALGFQSD